MLPASRQLQQLLSGNFDDSSSSMPAQQNAQSAQPRRSFSQTTSLSDATAPAPGPSPNDYGTGSGSAGFYVVTTTGVKINSSAIAESVAPAAVVDMAQQIAGIAESLKTAMTLQVHYHTLSLAFKELINRCNLKTACFNLQEGGSLQPLWNTLFWQAVFLACATAAHVLAR